MTTRRLGSGESCEQNNVRGERYDENNRDRPERTQRGHSTKHKGEGESTGQRRKDPSPSQTEATNPGAQNVACDVVTRKWAGVLSLDWPRVYSVSSRSIREFEQPSLASKARY